MERGERELELFRACFARNSERPRSIESLRWQYEGNPSGRLYVDVATADGGSRIAAIYATLPSFVLIGGRRRVCVQSLDTLTDTDYRGRGLFVKLAKQTFARATADDVALVYGFPNGNSAHGFFKKLDWVALDPVPFLIRPLRTGYFAGKLPKKVRPLASALPDVRIGGNLPAPAPLGARIVELYSADPRMTGLWEDFARDVGVGVERDEAYLRWRIFDKPGEVYRTIAVERGGRLDALCIFTLKDKHGGRVGYVMELLHRRGRGADARRLLRRAVNKLARDGADAVLAWCLPHSPNASAYTWNGFLPMPEKLRPIELHFGARAFDPSVASVVGDRASWYLSYLDSDTV